MNFGYLNKLEGHKESILYLTVNENNDLVSCSLDGQIIFWDLKTLKVKKKFNIPKSVRQEICTFNVQSGQIFTGFADGIIIVCRLDSGSYLYSLKGHTDQITSLVSVDYFLLSASQDCTIRSWNLKSIICEVVYQFSDPVSDIFLCDSLIFLASWDGFVRVINIEEGVISSEFKAGDKPLRSLCVDNNVIYSGGCDLIIKSHDIITGKVNEYKGFKSWVMGLKVLDDYLIAYCDDKLISVWNKNTSRLVEQFSGHLDGVTCLEISNSFMYSGGFDHSVLIWSIEEMKVRINEKRLMTREDIESRKIETYFRALNNNKKGRKNKKGKKSKKK